MMVSTQARFGFVLEYVSDIESAKRFFVDVLGLKVERAHPHFVQFKADNGADYAIADDEPIDPRYNRAPEVWWIVDDAGAAFSEMSTRAEVSLPLREMPFGKCFAIKDPAGQVQYLVELAQDRPSQPVP
jgi:predicted enzyme related to lactoylglutathione lyase